MTSPAAVLSKMALDQLISTPITTAIFFVYMRCMEGKPEDAWAYTTRKMKPTMLANWALWPLAHIVNFAFVPPAQRILYCNVVSLFWTTILSSITNEPTTAPPAEPAAARPPEQRRGAGLK